jgi:hypothetical protein
MVSFTNFCIASKVKIEYFLHKFKCILECAIEFSFRGFWINGKTLRCDGLILKRIVPLNSKVEEERKQLLPHLNLNDIRSTNKKKINAR